MRGALQQRVSEIYDKLSSKKKRATKRIFLNLVNFSDNQTTDPNWKPVRKRQLRSSFTDPSEQQVLTELIDANLLVSDARAGNLQEATVEIAHEILLTSWDRLKDWIEENHGAIALRNRLQADVDQWKEKKSDDELWAGSRLEQVLELSKDDIFKEELGGFQPEDLDFIKASVTKRDRQRRRELRTAWSFAGVVSVALVISIGLGWIARRQQRQAELNLAQSLGRESLALFDEHKHLEAMVRAVKAGRLLQTWKDTDPVTMDALHNVYYTRAQNQLIGHSASVTNVAFSPDNETIATASIDGTVKFWKRDGTPIETSNNSNGITHGLYVTSVVFSPDNETIATVGSSDGRVKLWQQDGTFVKILKDPNAVYDVTHSSGVTSVAFSPDDEAIATAGADKTVKLWKRDGTFFKILKDPNNSDGATHGSGVTDVAFSPDKKTIATADNDGIVKLWKRDGTFFKTLKDPTNPDGATHGKRVNHLVFSSDKETIATASADGTVKLWKQDGTLVETLEDPSSPENERAIYDLAFSPDNETIATANADGTVKLWKRNGTLVEILGKEELSHPDDVTHLRDTVSAVAFSPDNKTLATAGVGNMVKLWKWDGTFVEPLKDFKNSEDVTHTSIGRTTYPGMAVSVAFGPDNETLATASHDTAAKLWKRDGTFLTTLKASGRHDDVAARTFVNSVAFSPDNQMLATASADRTVKLWQQGGTFVRTLKDPNLSNPNDVTHRGSVLSVAFSPDNQMLATASADNTVKLWKQDGTLIATLKDLSDRPKFVGAANSVAFSPDNQMLATASVTKTVKLWRRDGTFVSTLKDPNPRNPDDVTHSRSVDSVAFSQDNQTIATASEDKTVKLWQGDGTFIATLKDPDNPDGLTHSLGVNSVAFAPDNQTIATAGADNTVKLWKRDGTFVETLKDPDNPDGLTHSSPVKSVAFSPDNQTIATASDDTVKLWRLNASTAFQLDNLVTGV